MIDDALHIVRIARSVERLDGETEVVAHDLGRAVDINVTQWPITRHATRTAVAAMASLLVARLFQLPEAYWAPITTIVIEQSSLGAALGPVAVAWATLGRPTRATLCTDAALCTKSTVIASTSPGADNVAVSPVFATSAWRCGRATSRRSSRATWRMTSGRRYFSGALIGAGEE